MDFSGLNVLLEEKPIAIDETYKISVLNEAGRIYISEPEATKESKKQQSIQSSFPLVSQFLRKATFTSDTDYRAEIEEMVFKQEPNTLIEEVSSSSILASLQGIAWNRDWDWSGTRIDDTKIESDFEYNLVVQRDHKDGFRFNDFKVSETAACDQQEKAAVSAASSDIRNWAKCFSDNGELVGLAPGLEKGLDSSSVVPMDEAPDLSMTLFNSYTRKVASVAAEGTATAAASLESETLDELESVSADIDGLLGDAADSFSTAVLGKKQTATEDEAAKKTWAHVIDVSTQFLNFKELVPEMAHKFPFELDTFQKHAVYHLEKNESVFVAAHTSAGKTVVAEYAVALAKSHMTKAIYTSPIKALSNQKYRDFHKTFDGDVGLLTGDVQINPEASCLIMTTEILRSMLYRTSPVIRDTEFLIFDEVHYVNDAERGVVWEEVIIMLPKHVTLVMLSATVPNVLEFAGWIGRCKQKDVYVISTEKRPVPLEHFIWNEKAGTANNANSGRLNLVVNANRQFLSSGYREAMNIGVAAAVGSPKQQQSSRGRGGGGGGRGGGRGGFQSGRGGSQSAKSSNAKFVNSSGSNSASGSNSSLNKNIASPNLKLIQHLRKRSLLPAVFFTFSKKRCEENIDSLGHSLDLNDDTNVKSKVHLFLEKSLSRLKGTDRELPQIVRMRGMLSRGLGVHHGGLLPIVKECVEILFSMGLVKVLFATETFAMGVNMPARTVVYTSVRKHDGKTFRTLLPGEYTQMSGRAGRRGLDSTGTVILMPPSDKHSAISMEESSLKAMILGTPTRLQSQFRLTYNMILCLLRVQSLRIEDMMKASFSENSTLLSKPENEKQLKEITQEYSDSVKLSCTLCESSIADYYSDNVYLISNLWNILNGMSREKLRYLFPGRLLVLAGGDAFVSSRNSIAILLKMHDNDDGTYFDVLAIHRSNSNNNNNNSLDMPPPLPFLNKLSSMGRDNQSKVLEKIPLTQVLFVTNERLSATDVSRLFDAKTGRPRNEQSLNEAVNKVSRLVHERSRERDPHSQWILESIDLNRWKGCTIQLEEEIMKRKEILGRIFGHSCNACPSLSSHYGIFHIQRSLEEKMTELENRLSSNNLALLPEYQGRIRVLEKLGFIEHSAGTVTSVLDSPSVVTLKGRVACELNTCDELITAELLFQGFFSQLEPEEIVAVMSCMVFQEKSDCEPVLTATLEKAKETILETVGRLVQLQNEQGVSVVLEDYLTNNLKFGLVEVVYEWARGMAFKQLTDLTDVLEGSIVRCIVRLDETCRELRSAARLIGDAELYRKMERAGQMIKRDICFAASLYY